MSEMDTSLINVHIVGMIKKWRSHRGYSSEVVADELGISTSTYNKIENRKIRLSSENAWKLADLYQISLDRLLGRDSVTLQKVSPEEADSLISEPPPSYNKPEPDPPPPMPNIIIQFGEGKNTPRGERFLANLGKILAGYDPDDSIWDIIDPPPGKE